MYQDFTLELIEERFGIKNQLEPLFTPKTIIQPAEPLRQALLNANDLPLRSSKASAEAIIFPILLDLRNRNEKFFTIHSGNALTADEEQELEGNCDFILAKESNSFTMDLPFFVLAEAEKGDIHGAIPRCAAQMIGLKIFNMKRNVPVETIYGCVTTGKNWIFMKVTDKVYIDKKTYYTDNITELLSGFQTMIEQYRTLVK
jgi:hypothetical protein